jgi:hypothetical protein
LPSSGQAQRPPSQAGNPARLKGRQRNRKTRFLARYGLLEERRRDRNAEVAAPHGGLRPGLCWPVRAERPSRECSQRSILSICSVLAIRRSYSRQTISFCFPFFFQSCSSAVERQAALLSEAYRRRKAVTEGRDTT